MEKKVLLGISITQTPISKNGGVPEAVSSKKSVAKNGLINFCLGEDGEIFKMPSFYEPSVFKEFSRFISKLKDYLCVLESPIDVASFEFIYFSHDGTQNTFLEDFGDAQKESYKKFKDQSESSLGEGHLEAMLLSLYEDTVREKFKQDFIGRLKLNHIGSSTKSSMNEIFGEYDLLDMNISLTRCFKNNVFPVLSNSRRAKDPLIDKKFLSLFRPNYLEDCLSTSSLSDDRGDFSPISHVRFYHGSRVDIEEASIITSKLLTIVDDALGFSSSSKLFQLNTLELEESMDSELIYLVGSSFSAKEIVLIKKLFYQGKKLIFDLNSVGDDFLAELNINFGLKTIKKSSLNLEVDLFIYELGESVMILFNSQELISLSKSLQLEFWKKIIYAAEIEYLEMDGAENLEYVWRKRQIKSSELDFEEVRRINFFNPYSETKEVNIKASERFFLLKVVDEDCATISRQSDRGMAVSLLPKGSVGIDFGVVDR